MRYMLSVAGNYNFLEFISNAKSGEFFFFSHDERFMIKTMKVRGPQRGTAANVFCDEERGGRADSRTVLTAM